VGKRGDGPVVLIGIFKLAKCLALLAVGIGALVKLPQQLGASLEKAVNWLGVSTGRESLERGIGKLDGLAPSTAHWLAVLVLAYAAVFAVEGYGLVRRRGWAEWLTVFVTSSFIPLELYELVRHFGAGKVITLALNVLIVLYLAIRLKQRGGLRRLFHRRPRLTLVGEPARPLAGARRVLSR
jgi:uncharacterized membrane protein (DUF2068 family)